MLKEITHEFEIEGKKVSFSQGKISPRSQTAVMAKMGDTVVLATANVDAPFGDADFFPMSVEYVEKLYAAGKISGSRFVKRERFPSDEAVLKARMIDRSFRSRFPGDYRNGLGLIVTVLSYDEENDPVLLGINAASAALMLSKAPFDGPVAGVKVGYKNDKFYPIFRAMEDTDETEKMNYVLSGDGDKFTMVDANSHEVTEDQVIEAMEYGLELMKPWVEAQKAFVAKFEEVEKAEYDSYAPPAELVDGIVEKYGDRIEEVLLSNNEMDGSEVKEEMYKEYEGQYTKSILNEAYEKVSKKLVRKLILSEEKRVDGRKLDEIRELNYEVGLLPRAHGSGLFSRGTTQAMTVATLGSARSAKLEDDMSGEGTKQYMHFYNAMPFSFGEGGRIRWIPGRREVGHGALAEKALKPVIPSQEEFPYTIILMSEIMSQNGSTSMASTVGSTMALMDAGVPIKRPVAGIAMGVVTNDDVSEYKILTDIQGVEDFYGDMDFKVTGTTEGVTAIQMDNKAAGLPIEVFKDAIEGAKKARLQIIEDINELMGSEKKELSKYAPKVAVVKIPTDKIGELIGPGGKNIRDISERLEVELDVEEDGTVNIFAEDQGNIDKAKAEVESIAFVPEVGEVYEGVVESVVEYGAFVEIAPGTSGLLHVSELSDEFVKNVKDFVNEGDKIKVKVLDVDDFGKIKLSLKALKKESKPSQS